MSGAEHIGLLQNPLTWTSISFFIIVGALVWKTWGKFMNFLDQRNQDIEDTLKEAQLLHKQAHQALLDAKAQEQKLLKDAKNLKSRTQDEIESIKKEHFAQLDADLKSREKKAQNRMEMMRRQAEKDLKDHLIKLTMEKCYANLSQLLNQKEKDSLFDNALKDLSKNLKIH